MNDFIEPSLQLIKFELIFHFFLFIHHEHLFVISFSHNQLVFDFLEISSLPLEVFFQVLNDESEFKYLLFLFSAFELEVFLDSHEFLFVHVCCGGSRRWLTGKGLAKFDSEIFVRLVKLFDQSLLLVDFFFEFVNFVFEAFEFFSNHWELGLVKVFEFILLAFYFFEQCLFLVKVVCQQLNFCCVFIFQFT